MPIQLDDLTLIIDSDKSHTVTAKFFSDKLTGTGGKVGRLNQNLLPTNKSATPIADHTISSTELKSSVTQNDITIRRIPLATLTRRSVVAGDITLPVPHVDDRLELGAIGSHKVLFDMTPQAVEFREDSTSGTSGTKTSMVIVYRMELYIIDNSTPEPQTCMVEPITKHTSNRVTVEWASDPLNAIHTFIDDHVSLVVDKDEINAWMSAYPIHERVVRLAEAWSGDQIAADVCQYASDVAAQQTHAMLNNLAIQLRYLENYNVSLDAYRVIHQHLEKEFDANTTSQLAKQNLNLLMNHTMSTLEALKPQLHVPAQPINPVTLSPQLSKQQIAALTTHEPLVMTQAGAGTGKSTVILERIKYLEQCGVDPSEITVLSFTNAAADHISEKNPNVGSMTIARKIIDIYALNHPTHKVSAIDTIINSIDIFYPNNKFAADFRHYLLCVDQNKIGSFTALNTFIENNFAAVIELLDKIEQTSLELQIIICYQKIDTMAEPPHVRSKFLIIDEVQDNSVFEFIYLLKYITKHEQNLFIVGDASQTLYEFRSANPRALNTLESSGVFTTFRLTTNYRSNQEILDFANVVLCGLETNQFANIQLQANSLAIPTADTFQEKVTLDYRYYPQKIGSFVTEDLAPLITNAVCPNYVQACLDRGEQVAFLAYSRREIATIQQQLEKQYPNKTVASLVSDIPYATDIFSKYIKLFWNDVLQVPVHNAAFAVHQGISNNMDKLTKNAGNQKVEKAILGTLAEWWLENSAAIKGWESLCQQGALQPAEFFDRLRDNLLDFEIARNQRKLNISKQRNQERKKKNLESKPDLVVSTIHGAKGLEFDNVVVVYKEDSSMAEDTKRMFYVAFTRAMKSQYVLAYGTLKNPPIQSSYEQMVAALAERDAKQAQVSAGIDPDLAEALVDKETGEPADSDVVS